MSILANYIFGNISNNNITEISHRFPFKMYTLLYMLSNINLKFRSNLYDKTGSYIFLINIVNMCNIFLHGSIELIALHHEDYYDNTDLHLCSA